MTRRSLTQYRRNFNIVSDLSSFYLSAVGLFLGDCTLHDKKDNVWGGRLRALETMDPRLKRVNLCGSS